MDILDYTTVDGPGFRTSIYCAGCHHACPGCHNPQSWNPKAGHPMTVDAIMMQIKENPFEGVTFSGGDPLYQLDGFTELARRIKAETDKNIWCFTGFTWEELIGNPDLRNLGISESENSGDPEVRKSRDPENQNPAILDFLQYIDVLVDGPFVQALRDENLLFRGSSNQRLIDVRKSLNAGEVVLWERVL